MSEPQNLLVSFGREGASSNDVREVLTCADHWDQLIYERILHQRPDIPTAVKDASTDLESNEAYDAQPVDEANGCIHAPL